MWNPLAANPIHSVPSIRDELREIGCSSLLWADRLTQENYYWRYLQQWNHFNPMARDEDACLGIENEIDFIGIAAQAVTYEAAFYHFCAALRWGRRAPTSMMEHSPDLGIWIAGNPAHMTPSLCRQLLRGPGPNEWFTE
jgi:hypothetical protein